MTLTALLSLKDSNIEMLPRLTLTLSTVELIVIHLIEASNSGAVFVIDSLCTYAVHGLRY